MRPWLRERRPVKSAGGVNARRRHRLYLEGELHDCPRAPAESPRLGRRDCDGGGARAGKDAMRIITADERLREKSGVKMLIAGPPKIGKTTLLYTLNPGRTLFIDFEAGDLAVKDWRGDTLRPRTWGECRDLACFLTGANPALPPTASYSQAHFDAIYATFKDITLDKYDTLFVDSITAVGRLCYGYAQEQPEAFSERSGR